MHDPNSRPPTLRPPLEVMRPRAARTIPREAALSGGVQYSAKLDGIRALLFVLEDERVVLQSRTGRDRAPDSPHIAHAAGTALPPGIVLDGELVAWRRPLRLRTAAALPRRTRTRPHPHLLRRLRPPRHSRGGRCTRAPAGTALGHAALRPRRCRPAPGNRPRHYPDRATAIAWHEGLVQLGVEVLVCRGLASRYRAGDRRSWIKIRHADTVDALVLSITGTPTRPYAVLLQMPNGRRVLTPKVDAVQARQIVDALVGQQMPGPADRAGVRILVAPLLAEAHRPSGRHGAVRFERLKPDQS